MLKSGQRNVAIESEIEKLFKSIVFSKERNRKLFEKWRNAQLLSMDLSGLARASSLGSMDQGIPNLIHDSVSAIEYETDLDDERRQLLKELQHLEETLNKEGETEAEKLLFEYTQTLPVWVKYFVYTILLILVCTLYWVFYSYPGGHYE